MALKKELVGSGVWGGTADAIGGSVVTGIVAHAGGTQAAAISDSASWLTGAVNVIATCATSADSCLLPRASAGDEIIVRNGGAAPCSVYPQSGGKINGGSADAAFTVTNAKVAIFKCLGGVDWVAGSFA